MFSKLFKLLVLSAFLVPAIANAQTVSVADAQAKCFTPPMGYIKTAIAKKLTDDMLTAGLIKPKARVNIQQLAPATPLPTDLVLKDVFANTSLIVTPPQCPTQPCNTPSTITISPPGSAVIGSCTNEYAINVNYYFYYNTSQVVNGQPKTKQVKFQGTLDTRVSIPGTLAPFKKKKT